MPRTYVSDDEEPPRRTGWFFVVVVLLLAVLAGLLFAFARTLGVFDTKAATVGIPPVIGRTYAIANRELVNRGFVVVRQGQESAAYAKGLVVDSKPTGGDQAPKGSKVVLYVSEGVGQAVVPVVTGQTQEAADKLIRSRGLQTNVQSETSTSVAAGLVTRTDPAAGRTIPETQVVQVYVSTGPPPTTTTTFVPRTTTTTSTTTTTTKPTTTTTKPTTTTSSTTSSTSSTTSSTTPTTGPKRN